MRLDCRLGMYEARLYLICYLGEVKAIASHIVPGGGVG